MSDRDTQEILCRRVEKCRIGSIRYKNGQVLHALQDSDSFFAKERTP
jgi:hypothetical protein